MIIKKRGPIDYLYVLASFGCCGALASINCFFHSLLFLVVAFSKGTQPTKNPSLKKT